MAVAVVPRKVIVTLPILIAVVVVPREVTDTLPILMGGAVVPRKVTDTLPILIGVAVVLRKVTDTLPILMGVAVVLWERTDTLPILMGLRSNTKWEVTTNIFNSEAVAVTAETTDTTTLLRKAMALSLMPVPIQLIPACTHSLWRMGA